MLRNIFYTFLMLCATSLFTGCSDEDEGGEPAVPEFELTGTDLSNLAHEGGTFAMKVESNTEWTATSNKGWCKVETASSGNGLYDVNVIVSENLYGENRSATVTFQWGEDGEKKDLAINQKAKTYKKGDKYKLPVVFQVLYANANVETQYVRKGHLKELLDAVNKLYAESGQNIGVEFVMADVDPEGNLMEEPGVNRIEWTTPKIDCQKFMESSEQRYLDIIWDPAKYINIVLYEFSKPSILGISQFPLLAPSYELPGMETIEGDIPSHQDLTKPRCVSINNKNIYETGPLATPEHPDGTLTGVVATVAHELGHYLGLRHAFSENTEGTECVDSDFCTDTPTYDRQKYETKFYSYGMEYKKYMDELITRIDGITGERFVSNNIMDYSITYSDKFTPQQAERIRYILENAVLVPGPKSYDGNKAKSRTGVKADLPFEVME